MIRLRPFSLLYMITYHNHNLAESHFNDMAVYTIYYVLNCYVLNYYLVSQYSLNLKSTKRHHITLLVLHHRP